MLRVIVEGPRACGKSHLIREVLVPQLRQAGRGVTVYDEDSRLVVHHDGVMPVEIRERQTRG